MVKKDATIDGSCPSADSKAENRATVNSQQAKHDMVELSGSAATTPTMPTAHPSTTLRSALQGLAEGRVLQVRRCEQAVAHSLTQDSMASVVQYPTRPSCLCHPGFQWPVILRLTNKTDCLSLSHATEPLLSQ
ncbi:hypothetical protein E2C01_022559 [Portunus trituberculatus]|uniref:Uncharacterized protein n=1 Tax=Portunus trituberculatus TaxID=210409 RepID=A0A5B7E5P7_PORTR|nr:hypothetical protein [Portunus trituberculatus]